jgi:uncharacterized protein (TIRG00374 family)
MMMKRGKFILRIVISLGITAFFVWFAFRGRDLGSLSHTLLQQPVIWFFILFALQTLSHLLRAVRWKFLLEPVKHSVSVHGAFASLMIGFMINGIVPRAGELVRSYVLGRKETISANAVFSTVILERILDIISFAAVLCLVVIVNADSIVIWFPSLDGAAWIVEAAGLLLLAAFVLFFIKSHAVFSSLKRITVLLPIATRERMDRFIDSFLHGFQAGGNAKNYGSIALLTCSIWSTYIVLLYLPMHLFGMELLTITSAATLQVSNGLASAMPTPNGIGSYHSFLALTLTRVFKVPDASALAYVVYTHAISYLCTLIIGTVYLFRENVHFAELVSAKQES